MAMTSAAAYASTFFNITRRIVGGATEEHASDASLNKIRIKMIDAVLDCPPARTRRARVQVNSAESAQQLWLVRGEVYQAVSDEFGQHEAERRLATLEPLFPKQVREPQRSAIRRLRK